eukprot:NODE_2626_length_764_cov_137.067133_g1838_i0.p1 GENE.NODE_2626_length_764_cov_137.067133_g1838_i0~~NODE_2626_length_764_cov_137.067133_g1838_i0.p1  ORF type:complete len:114 (-),score=1.72 NODE_2626_length_764_cov_137.067133_g1838_i0:195-536(-)
MHACMHTEVAQKAGASPLLALPGNLYPLVLMETTHTHLHFHLLSSQYDTRACMRVCMQVSMRGCIDPTLCDHFFESYFDHHSGTKNRETDNAKKKTGWAANRDGLVLWVHFFL